MIVTEIPFNKSLGIKQSELSDYILMLENSEKYTNHLGTIHARAQFVLADNRFMEYWLIWRRLNRVSFGGCTKNVAKLIIMRLYPVNPLYP